VRLRVWKPDAWYMASKPLHPTQERVADEKEWMEFTLTVIVNEELTQQLMTYGHRLEVLKPLSLRQELYSRAQKILERNAPQEPSLK
jgi:predicted DNA-binding transcriptional regulator YafY